MVRRRQDRPCRVTCERELEASFPGPAARCDAVVTENGAVVQVGGQVWPMGPPVERELQRPLEARGVPLGRTGDADDIALATVLVASFGGRVRDRPDAGRRRGTLLT